MNEYQPLKVETAAVASQGTAFATNGKAGKGKEANKFLPDNEWYNLSTEAREKIIKARNKGKSEKPESDDKSVSRSKSAKSTKSLSKPSRHWRKRTTS